MYGGDGLARVDGKVVLTPYVLPGETVRVEAVRETGDLRRARLVEVLRPAPERVTAPCPHFSRCGGCQYQHAPYELQVEWKRRILREVFERAGRIALPEAIPAIVANPFEYRNRVQLHLDGGRIGFRRAGSRRLWPVDHCPVAAPALNEALAALRRMLPQPRFPRFLRSIELFTNGSEVQVNALDMGGARLAKGFFEWLAKQVPGADRPALEYAAAGDVFRVGHRSFFQSNRFLVDVMAEAATVGLEGESALDLYAGVGLFSLPLARRFGEVTAVESSAGAVADLRFNAERAGLPVRAVRGTAELFLESVERRPDLLFADPPRAGIGKGVVRQALRLRPPEIVLVSCDPATAARDVALLVAGGYHVRDCALIDLFPQTSHIESVIRLSAG